MTMLAFLVIFLVLSAASCALVLVVARRAPEGYEDEDGFQLGPIPPDHGMRPASAGEVTGAGVGQYRAKAVRTMGSPAREFAPPLEVC